MATVAELIEIIGRDAVTRLQTVIGSRYVYVPTNPRPGDPIYNAIGHLAAAKLSQELGGTMIWAGNGYAKLQRNQAIAQLLAVGVSHDTCARRFGLTRKTIKNVERLETAQRPGGLRARRLYQENLEARRADLASQPRQRSPRRSTS